MTTSAPSAEAKATIAMAPYDTLSHAGLSWIMSAAGDHEAAIAWAEFGASHDPHPREWYFDDLINAYDDGRQMAGCIEIRGRTTREPSPSKYWYKVLARAYAATGQMDKAKVTWKKFDSLPDPPE